MAERSYLVNENQERQAVVVPMAEWERIQSELEELSDIRAYDEANAINEETVPFEQAVREIEEGYR